MQGILPVSELKATLRNRLRARSLEKLTRRAAIGTGNDQGSSRELQPEISRMRSSNSGSIEGRPISL
jgi:hypothetical protein